MNIIKRDGSEVPFNPENIINAVRGANNDSALPPHATRLSELQIQVVEEQVEKRIKALNRTAGIEEIQDLVIHAIMAQQAYEVAQLYTEYRYKKYLKRLSNTTDATILSILEATNEEAKQENSNKNPVQLSTQRDYMAGTVSKDITWRILMPQDIKEAHELGIIHFHDADYYAQHMHNCDLINLDDMLQNGTVITDTLIDKPHRLLTAANITTQIIAQVASNQYGGQTFSLAALAPFVDISRQAHIEAAQQEGEQIGVSYTPDQLRVIADLRLKAEISSAIQTIQYQLLTLMTTNGQTPFVSMCMDLHEAPEGQCRDDLALLMNEVFLQRIVGIKNRAGVYVTPAFPKLLYVLHEDNVPANHSIQEQTALLGARYLELTTTAAYCSTKRMVPDYISAKIMRQAKGDVYPCMGCRSFLTPDRFSDKLGNIARAGNYVPGEHKYYGRFNQGVVTINLPDVALSATTAHQDFWELLDERLDLCHRALRLRHEHLLGTPSDVAPILWQHGALARLQPGETIDELLYHGYSTISLGYAGIYEMTKVMTGQSHTEPEGRAFALKVMQRLNDRCQQWKEEENIDYSVYGTPLESTTYKFAKSLQERFGIIDGITDRGYITNSYHVNVREQINAFDKLAFESEFQLLSPGGAISYVEMPDMSNNQEAVLDIIRFIYDHIMYAEINTKNDYCHRCGSTEEILAVPDEHGKLVWECQVCKNRDERSLTVPRRTCGYIGTQFWNQGRTEEIKDRVLHVSIPYEQGSEQSRT